MAGGRTHISMTVEAATDPAVGFLPEDARIVADANAATDLLFRGWRNRYRHENTGWPWREPSQLVAAEAELADALEQGSLILLGRGLHSVQDFYVHGGRFRSYLHPPREPTSERRPERFADALAASKEYLRRYREAGGRDDARKP